MKLRSDSFTDNGKIPGRIAFGVMDPKTHIALSDNRNPHLAWSDVPAGTKSFAVICHDYDVPSKGDDVNQEGRSIPASLPRVDFFHWILVDSACLRSLPLPKANFRAPSPRAANPVQLQNTVRVRASTIIPPGSPAMPTWAGDYFGYDGPCPPWNDTILHHYVFTVYALDVRQTRRSKVNSLDSKCAMR